MGLLLKMHLVGFGDSISRGVFVSEKESFLSLINEYTGINVTNSGVAGNNSLEALTRLKKDVIELYPDYVIIQFGMNDHYLIGDRKHNVSPDNFRRNLLKMIEVIRKNNAIPLIMTIHPVVEGNNELYYYSRHPKSLYQFLGGVSGVINFYNNIILAISKETKTPLIDINKTFFRLQDKGYSFEELLLTLNNSDKNDGVHLSNLGHLVYAAKSIKVLEQLVKKRFCVHSHFNLEKKSEKTIYLEEPGTYCVSFKLSCNTDKISRIPLVEIKDESGICLQKVITSLEGEESVAFRLKELERPQRVCFKNIGEGVGITIGKI